MPDYKNFIAKQHEIEEENRKVRDGKGNPTQGVTQQVNRNANTDLRPGYGEGYPSPHSAASVSGAGKTNYSTRVGEQPSGQQGHGYVPPDMPPPDTQGSKEQSRQGVDSHEAGLPYRGENDGDDDWKAEEKSFAEGNGQDESDDESVQSPFSRQDFASYTAPRPEQQIGHSDGEHGPQGYVDSGPNISQAHFSKSGYEQTPHGYENDSATYAYGPVNDDSGYVGQAAGYHEDEDSGEDATDTSDVSDDDDLIEVSVDDLYVPEENSYSIDPEEISSLADSIADLGVLENLVVASLDDESDRFAILSGQRRYLAVKKLIGEGRLPSDYQFVCRVRELDKVEVPDAGKLDSETAMLYLIATGNESRTLTPEDRLLRTRQLGKVFDRIRESGGQQRSIPKKDFVSQCLGMSPRDAQRLISIEDNGSDLLKTAFSSGVLSVKAAELISKMPVDDQNEFLRLTPNLSKILPETVEEFRLKKRKQALAGSKGGQATAAFPADEINELLNSFDPLDEYCVSLADTELDKDLADKILSCLARISRDRDGLIRVLKKAERQILKAKLKGTAPPEQDEDDEEDGN